MGAERKEIVLPEQLEGAVVPVDVKRLVAIVDAFDQFKAMVLKESDFWLDTRENKKRVKKSGWLKYALACNVNLEKVEEREVDKELPPESGNWVTVYHFDYRAIAPTGRYAEGSGSASTDERDESGKILHDTRSLAQTRAMNRAISHLVGGGEISAEEAMGGRRYVESTQNKKPAPRRRNEEPPELDEEPGEREQTQLRIGKVTLSSLEFNIKAFNPDLVDVLSIVGTASGFEVTPKDKLDDGTWYELNDLLKGLGCPVEWSDPSDKEPYGKWSLEVKIEV